MRVAVCLPLADTMTGELILLEDLKMKTKIVFKILFLLNYLQMVTKEM
jgi:hypothetical protein